MATAWEIAIKHRLGRLRFPIERFDAEVSDLGALAVVIKAAHAVRAGGLPRHHDDPFDRMLVAQAQVETFVLVTTDAMSARYDVPLLRPKTS